MIHRKWFSIVAVFVLGLMTAVPLHAADPRNGNANWNNLKKLSPGDDIRIVLNDAKSYEAKFQSASDEAITVRLVTGEQTFSRESVLRVSSKRTSHRGRGALIGAAVGVAAALAIDASCGDCTAGTWAGDTLGIGVLGAGVGALVSRGAHWHDVYRAVARTGMGGSQEP
jgi:hypothetical protein